MQPNYVNKLKGVSDMKYSAQEQEGRDAPVGTRCPYGATELGKRCAWLAGHYDTHGEAAWGLARR